ncbi:hypothetical protein [Bradyrhizobium sp. SBR1B]|uniref:hypothetical protein n=1 Tax=Bradyrhizobium sp. SBR1B TaxID=2663836 RepID=UPI0017A73A83|nr:hypothetical protein [Bradyrhizobium sp. SBR1B]MBB4383674.1 hypothetical protein [Bradyrhizobium sp. SBR1B]
MKLNARLLHDKTGRLAGLFKANIRSRIIRAISFAGVKTGNAGFAKPINASHHPSPTGIEAVATTALAVFLLSARAKVEVHEVRNKYPFIMKRYSMTMPTGAADWWIKGMSIAVENCATSYAWSGRRSRSGGLGSE